ncbi:hypothetical protein SAMN05421819_2634 [Bryocella elongata]|uniref:Uncharacterized protein n=1 Tax=Bryocella elongata TaxID=863522 RepID=A0A1H5ZGK6_9BACT|nr:hypothetical protein SAMN05421819_2634 [Bryocella elongata]
MSEFAEVNLSSGSVWTRIGRWVPRPVWAAVLAISFTALCGWGYLHFSPAFTILGAPGVLAYLAISQTDSEDGVAKLMLEALYVLVNSLFYYFVIRFIQRRLLRKALR